jgi:RNA polymerase sigma-32 factor
MLKETDFNDHKTDDMEAESLPLPVDLYKRYLAEVQKYPVLTKEEENEVSRLVFDHGDPNAAHKLTVSNLRLVVKISLEYYNAYLNVLDLIQEGNVGLLHAVKKYNPYRGTRFSTYASFWIRAYILKHIMDSWSLVKIGTTQAQRKLFYRLKREKQRLEAQGIYPAPQLVAKNFGLKEQEVEDMEKRLSYTDVALEVPVHNGTDETLMDEISSNQDVEEIVAERFKTVVLSKKLKEFRATLDDRDLYIFNNRLASDEPMSLHKIGANWQISRERVRQVETRILRRFKSHCQGNLAELGLETAIGNAGEMARISSSHA